MNLGDLVHLKTGRCREATGGCSGRCWAGTLEAVGKMQTAQAGGGPETAHRAGEKRMVLSSDFTSST